MTNQVATKANPVPATKEEPNIYIVAAAIRRNAKAIAISVHPDAASEVTRLEHERRSLTFKLHDVTRQQTRFLMEGFLAHPDLS